MQDSKQNSETADSPYVVSYGFTYQGAGTAVMLGIRIPDPKGVYQDPARMLKLVRAIEEDIEKYMEVHHGSA